MRLALEMEEEFGRPPGVLEKAGSGLSPSPQKEPALQHLDFSPTMLILEF